jgi:hypothetical protein
MLIKIKVKSISIHSIITGCFKICEFVSLLDTFNFIETHLEAIDFLLWLYKSICFWFIAWHSLKTTLISFFLFCSKLVMPSLYIHDSLRWLNNLRLVEGRLDSLLVLNLWGFSILLISIVIHFLVFSLDKQRAESSTFLWRGVVVFKKFVQELVTYSNFKFLILEISFLSSLLFYLHDVAFNLFRHYWVHDLPEELSLRKL